jgi:hypothetical protein
LKTLFDIRTDESTGKGQTLLLELGPDHCSYGFFHPAAKKVTRLSYFSFDETSIEESFGSILHGLEEISFKKTAVCSAFPQALLMPQQQFNNDYTLLRSIYDEPGQAYKHDAINEWQMVNVYSLPSSVLELCESAFPSAQYRHTYTPALKIYNGFVAENQISIHFTTQKFRVLLKKEGYVHLVQTYLYATPLDVVYFLLKICYEFGLDQSEVSLILSGLVEMDSSLYEDLHQYFIHIHFAQPPVYELPESSHPHYYFSSLYNLAACVS